MVGAAGVCVCGGVMRQGCLVGAGPAPKGALRPQAPGSWKGYPGAQEEIVWTGGGNRYLSVVKRNVAYSTYSNLQ